MKASALKRFGNLIFFYVAQPNRILKTEKSCQGCAQVLLGTLFAHTQVKNIPVIPLVEGQYLIKAGIHVIGDIILFRKDRHEPIVQLGLLWELLDIAKGTGQIAFEQISVIVASAKHIASSFWPLEVECFQL